MQILLLYKLCLQVIWYHNEKPVKESADIQLLFEGDRCTLVIREAYLEDAGFYKVTAKNDHGVAESACKLHVERKLRVMFDVKVFSG